VVPVPVIMGTERNGVVRSPRIIGVGGTAPVVRLCRPPYPMGGTSDRVPWVAHGRATQRGRSDAPTRSNGPSCRRACRPAHSHGWASRCPRPDTRAAGSGAGPCGTSCPTDSGCGALGRAGSDTGTAGSAGRRCVTRCPADSNGRRAHHGASAAHPAAAITHSRATRSAVGSGGS